MRVYNLGCQGLGFWSFGVHGVLQLRFLENHITGKENGSRKKAPLMKIYLIYSENS